MSDFDEEAEREKLRERFEAEEKDREATARMSELLLQGATMTNRHCDACHSPVFTYQGQSFCPTCQVEIGDPDGETADADAGADPADADHAPSEPTASADTDAESGSEPVAAGDSRSATRIEVDDPGNGADPASGPPSAPSEPERGTSPKPAPERPPTSESTASTPGPASTTDTDGSADTDLAAAQASLSRTLARLSRKAERSEDLSRTREHLLAVQEAAEALSALKQARR